MFKGLTCFFKTFTLKIGFRLKIVLFNLIFFFGGEANIFYRFSFNYANLSIHTKFQASKLPGTTIKVFGGWVVGGGWC